ncbi:MAG: magnesium transporter [Actinomycetota bacterium]
MSERQERVKSSRASVVFHWVGLAARAVLGPPARAVRGSARRVADPGRQVVDYWASERVTMRQGFVAVTIAALTSLVAGITLAAMEGRLAALPGLLVLVPASIGMRGSIFGALSARLGTTIHSGLFEVSWDREGALYQNVYAAGLLTIATSAVMGALARWISMLLGQETVPVWDMIIVALTGGLLSSAIVLIVTVAISVRSFTRGWDLDSVGSPLITAIGDVVTLPCLWISSYLVELEVLSRLVGALGIGIAIVSVVGGWRSARQTVRRVVRESFPVLCLAIVLAVLAGAIVQPRAGEIFTAFPAFLILLPGFLGITGALGGILSARLGSKLHLGAVTPSARPEPAALLDATIVLALGFVVYAVTAGATLGVSALTDRAYPGTLRFAGIVMVGGALATIAASLIGYYAAIATYRFGFDPDNHTIPLVTSGMDLLGVICLVIALGLFGVA